MRRRRHRHKMETDQTPNTKLDSSSWKDPHQQRVDSQDVAHSVVSPGPNITGTLIPRIARRHKRQVSKDNFEAFCAEHAHFPTPVIEEACCSVDNICSITKSTTQPPDAPAVSQETEIPILENQIGKRSKYWFYRKRKAKRDKLRHKKNDPQEECTQKSRDPADQTCVWDWICSCDSFVETHILKIYFFIFCCCTYNLYQVMPKQTMIASTSFCWLLGMTLGQPTKEILRLCCLVTQFFTCAHVYLFLDAKRYAYCLAYMLFILADLCILDSIDMMLQKQKARDSSRHPTAG